MQILANDGLPLNVYCTDMIYSHTVVFINAIGISGRVTEQLSQHLFSCGVNFVTWDLRGSPGAYRDDFRSYNTDHHVSDLLAVVNSLQIEKSILASWCSGTPTAISAVSQKMLTPLSMLAFNVPNYTGVPRQNMMGNIIDKMCSHIVKNEDQLELFYKTIIERNTLNDFTRTANDQKLEAFIHAPFKSGAQAMLRYAYALSNAPSPTQIQQWCKGVKVPVTLYGGRMDTLVSFQDAVELSKFIDNSTVRVMDNWNHYSLFHDTDIVTENIESIIRDNR